MPGKLIQSGRLIERTPITLNTFQLRAVKRLYDGDLPKETIVEKSSYLSDNLNIKGYLARPAKAGKYPLLIWNRGGWREHGGLDNLTAFLILASTDRWGYVVLATQYRGNFGGEGVEDWGCDDVNDAYNLIELAQEIRECDTDRIAVEGASRGGMTTYHMLTMYDKFKCAIVHAGVSDVAKLVSEDEQFAGFADRRWGDLSSEERQKQIALRSAVNYADKFPETTPILLMHGTNDKIIPFSQSESMAARLTELGHQHEFASIEGGGHVALKDGSYVEIDLLRKAWLDRWMG